jgi:hypothetical protein
MIKVYPVETRKLDNICAYRLDNVDEMIAVMVNLDYQLDWIQK